MHGGYKFYKITFLNFINFFFFKHNVTIMNILSRLFPSGTTYKSLKRAARIKQL